MTSTEIRQRPPKQKVPAGKLIPRTAYAQQKGISPRTLDRWVEQGIVEPPIDINGRKYFGDSSETEETRS
jgi:DNA-binding transcriptional MerR regulator